jgi:hypothetical protein
MGEQELFITVMSVSFLLVGLLLVGKALLPVWHSWKSENWPSTTGVVKKASVKEAAISTLDCSLSCFVYSVSVVYWYAIDGIQFLSDRVQFGDELHTVEEIARDDASDYVSWKAVKVYYDPQKPEKAVLKPGAFRLDYGVLAVGIGTFMVGVISILVWF